MKWFMADMTIVGGVKINQLIIRGEGGGAREDEGRTECPVHTLGKDVERERGREIVE